MLRRFRVLRIVYLCGGWHVERLVFVAAMRCSICGRGSLRCGCAVPDEVVVPLVMQSAALFAATAACFDVLYYLLDVYPEKLLSCCNAAVVGQCFSKCPYP